jgi:cytochrome b subunit of formate dehydrogenase
MKTLEYIQMGVVRALVCVALAWAPGAAWAADEKSEEPKAEEAAAVEFADADCLQCHDDPTATRTLPDGTERPFNFSQAGFEGSIHAPLGCVGCHTDIKELPHEMPLKPVDCGSCHGDAAALYAKSLHGQAVAKNDPLAPQCWDCHSAHETLPRTDPKSRTNPIHIPEMCGACHAEDAAVAKSRNVSQHDILQNYDESMHAVGLFQQGLKVTAVCTSCHTAHSVLPHTDPESTINRDNIVGVCTQCHALIEEVHEKVIEGKLWEEQPDKVPVCIDCHQPHQARTVFYEEGVSDRDCMECHAKDLPTADGKTMAAVSANELRHSTHFNTRCAQCHTGVDAQHAERPCATVIEKVDCSICHADQVNLHRESMHGQLLAKNDPDAPECLDCHGAHGTKSKRDPQSPTFARNIPELCGKCHREGEAAAKRLPAEFAGLVKSYNESVHGEGLLQSGLVNTATCVSCHTAHSPLPPSDPKSTVNASHIADTCGQCHQGIEEEFLKSIHSPLVSAEKNLPVCSSCHTAHTIARTSEQQFRFDIVDTCGKCHEDVTETYFDTYHGKVSKLGSDLAAKCYDCHGAHDILPPSDPASHLSRENIVQTCAECHPGANRRFAGYLTHATHHDPHKYPALFFAFWGMTALLVGTFGFFGLHTLMWIPRSWREMRKQRVHVLELTGQDKKMVVRFPAVVRQLHFVLIISFFALALTGMALKFSYMPWAQMLARGLGGFAACGIIHRVAAVAMVLIFIAHLGYIVHRKRETGSTWKQILLGSGTLLPTWRDVKEFIATVKWFWGKGPRPQYGEWTYWEKFDYFAVFWGVAIIGSTGFFLWFPELFTRVLPGWLINVATIIHSDEALLAVGFIFTIHFFNTHFRPEKFPMDMAMFTGLVPEEELKEERPSYYEELKQSGELEGRMRYPAPKEFRFWAAAFGTLALIVGFGLVLLIIWSMVFGYR